MLEEHTSNLSHVPSYWSFKGTCTQKHTFLKVQKRGKKITKLQNINFTLKKKQKQKKPAHQIVNIKLFGIIYITIF